MTDVFATTLLRAEYEGIEFPVSMTDVKESHTLVKRSAFRQRGHDLEHGGYDGSDGTLDIPLYNDLQGYGELFPGLYRRLLAKLRSTPIGRLTHPLLGVIVVGVESWTHGVESQKRNGVTVKLTWTLRGANVTDALLSFRNDARSTPDVAARAATVADETAAGAGGATVAPSAYQNVAPVVDEQLSFIEDDKRTTTEIESAFNTMLDRVTVNGLVLDAQSVPATWATLRRDLATTRASILSLRTRYLPQSQRSAVFVVPEDMPLWQVAAHADVYGDATKAYLLSASNTFSNPALVRKGTRVEVLPLG